MAIDPRVLITKDKWLPGTLTGEAGKFLRVTATEDGYEHAETFPQPLPWSALTTYNYPDVVAASDGYEYRCVGTGVLNVDPISGDPAWVRLTGLPTPVIADAGKSPQVNSTGTDYELALKEDALGDPSADNMALYSLADGTRSWRYTGVGATPSTVKLTGGISGFDISRTGDLELTVTAGVCMDSTGSVPLALNSASVLTMATSDALSGTIFHIGVMKHASTGVISVQTYATEAAMIADATYSNHRWLGFWRYTVKVTTPTVINPKMVVGLMVDGYMIFGKNSENIPSPIHPYTSNLLAANVWATIDHSTHIPVDRIVAIEYGCKHQYADGWCYTSLDGVNTDSAIGYSANSAPTDLGAWGHSSYQNSVMLPFTTTRQFRSTQNYQQILIHAVKLRR